MSDEQRYAEAAILQELTADGQIPVEFCFVLDDALVGWNAREGGFAFYLVEDDSLYLACVDYVQTRTNRWFSNLKDLAEHAHAHNWPNLEQFDVELAAWRLRIEE